MSIYGLIRTIYTADGFNKRRDRSLFFKIWTKYLHTSLALHFYWCVHSESSMRSFSLTSLRKAPGKCSFLRPEEKLYFHLKTKKQILTMMTTNSKRHRIHQQANGHKVEMVINAVCNEEVLSIAKKLYLQKKIMRQEERAICWLKVHLDCIQEKFTWD